MSVVWVCLLIEPAHWVSGPPLRVGLFGGTFDPPHLGHLIAAEQVKQQTDLDQVWLVVANDPWQKTSSRVVTEARIRFSLIEAALAPLNTDSNATSLGGVPIGAPINEPSSVISATEEAKLALYEAQMSTYPLKPLGLVPSNVEIVLGGPSQTVRTIEFVNEARSNLGLAPHLWSVIVGADAAADLDTWHRPSDLRNLARIFVVDRPGNTKKPFPDWGICHVEVPAIEISSTAIRRSIANRNSVRFMVPAQVLAIIESLGLYRQRT